MTKEQLPERLRNIPGLEMYDPSEKKKRKIVLSDAKIDIFAQIFDSIEQNHQGGHNHGKSKTSSTEAGKAGGRDQ